MREELCTDIDIGRFVQHMTYDNACMKEKFCTDTDIGRFAQHMPVHV